MPRGLKPYFIVGWLLLTPLTLAAAFYLYSNRSAQTLAAVLSARDEQASLFSAPPPILGGVSYEITSGDARPHLVEKFLQQYRSPIRGHGAVFVQMADKYGLDWRLVAAIGLQESGLGRAMPAGSYNAWGWAIYTGQNSGAEFDSWPHAIETVTRGIAQNYYARGLKTPEQIQTRYAPASNGSWAASVRFAMEEIED